MLAMQTMIEKSRLLWHKEPLDTAIQTGFSGWLRELEAETDY